MRYVRAVVLIGRDSPFAPLCSAARARAVVLLDAGSMARGDAGGTPGPNRRCGAMSPACASLTCSMTTSTARRCFEAVSALADQVRSEEADSA
jgi:hypothetical protein